MGRGKGRRVGAQHDSPTEWMLCLALISLAIFHVLCRRRKWVDGRYSAARLFPSRNMCAPPAPSTQGAELNVSQVTSTSDFIQFSRPCCHLC